MASPPSLPCGASFSPADAELITVYLTSKIDGTPLPAPTARYIHDADIYAADPASLVAGRLPASPKNSQETREWYFFTSVRAKSSRDTRRCRTVAEGAGTWHSEKGRRDVLDGNELVGYRQFFTFEPRNGWLMLEFSLVDPGAQDGAGNRRGEAMPVLCKIYQTCRHSASKSSSSMSGSKRKAGQGGRSSSEGSSARVRRCLQFGIGSPPAAPNQLASVTATSGYDEFGFLVRDEPREEHESEDPKEPDKQQESWGTTTPTMPLVPLEQEAEQSQYSEVAVTLEQDADGFQYSEFAVSLEQEAEESQYSEFAVPLEQEADQSQYSEFAVPLEQEAEGSRYSELAVPLEQEVEGSRYSEFAVPLEQEAEGPQPKYSEFGVPLEQETDEPQYSDFAGAPLIPMTSYGTTSLLHPGQDWTTTEIPQGTDSSTLPGNTAGLSCYDGMTTSLPSYNTSIWSFPSSMYSWCGAMSTRAEWANRSSNTDPLSSLCI